MTFARTKIQAPQPRATFVARGALHERLAQALQTRRLVLVCAPAGFGKTTALANEITALSPGHALAWIAADPGDDLHRLLECMLTALEPYDPPWRTAPEALVARAAEGTDDARRAIAAEILNTLDACDVPHGLIVFEDVHRINDRAFFEFLDLLLERLGARWTIAITSREDPPLALARLRAADELGEFRQAQLQFSRGEARTLAAQAGIEPELADRLFDRTKGWPAGMRLAASAAAGAGASVARTSRTRAPGIDRALFDYLVAEVVDRLRPELREFLSHVSVLAELVPERCVAVSGNPRAARLLDEIERLGLFVDVVDTGDAGAGGDDAVTGMMALGGGDNEAGDGGDGDDGGDAFDFGSAATRRALRLHDLLRDALQRRLELDQPDLLAALRERAAATEPDPIRRVGLLLAAGKPEEAGRLVVRHGPVMLADGAATSVTHLLKSFDPAFCRQSPDLQYVSGLVAWYCWDFAGMLAAMARAEAAYGARGDTEAEEFARAYRASAQIALGRLAEGGPVLEAMRDRNFQDLPAPTRIVVLNGLNWLALETGALKSIGPNVDEMVRLLEAAGRLELWYQTTPSARLPGLPGMGRPLERHAEALLRIARDEPTPLRALAWSMQARRTLWEGNFDEAARFIELARADARWARDAAPVRALILAHMTLWHAMRGERDEAVALTRKRIDENQSGYGQSGIYHLLQFAVRIAAICDDLPMIRETLRRLDAVQAALAASDGEGPGYRRVPPQRPLAGNVAWLEGRADDAIALWSDALRDEEAIDMLGQASEVRLRLACAMVRAGRASEAAAVLQPALAPAAGEHAPGGALLAAQALRELAGFDWGRALPAAQQALLRDWWALLAEFQGGSTTAGTAGDATGDSSTFRDVAPAPGSPTGGSGGSSASVAPAGLTRRETEVLERIAAGDSNKLIARAFDLSLHTVKRHVAHILDKLQLESRGQAAAWYRQHQT